MLFKGEVKYAAALHLQICSSFANMHLLITLTAPLTRVKDESNMCEFWLNLWRAWKTSQICEFWLNLWRASKVKSNVLITLTLALTHVKAKAKYATALPHLLSLSKARPKSLKLWLHIWRSSKVKWNMQQLCNLRFCSFSHKFQFRLKCGALGTVWL